MIRRVVHRVPLVVRAAFHWPEIAMLLMAVGMAITLILVVLFGYELAAQQRTLDARVNAAINQRQRQVAATNEQVRVDTCLVLNSATLRRDPSVGGLRMDLRCGPVTK